MIVQYVVYELQLAVFEIDAKRFDFSNVYQRVFVEIVDHDINRQKSHILYGKNSKKVSKL